MEKYYIGIDLGGTTAKFGLFNTADKLLHSFSMPTNFINKNPEKFLLDNMSETIISNLKKFNNKIKLKQLIGIGIGIPGPAIKDKFVLNAVNINWNKKFNIENEFRKRLHKDIKVFVNNDANIAALGEYYFGSGKKDNSICLIIIGTGLGMGIVVNGNIIEGASGQAGEVGHIKVDYSENAFRCNCNNYGCLETVSSGTGIVNVYNRLDPNNIDEYINSKDIFDKYKKNDKRAVTAINESMSYLVKTMYMIERVLNPDCFIIGGGVSNADKDLLKILNDLIEQNKVNTWSKPKIKIAKLKNKAGIYGAYALVRDKIKNEN